MLLGFKFYTVKVVWFTDDVLVVNYGSDITGLNVFD